MSKNKDLIRQRKVNTRRAVQGRQTNTKDRQKNNRMGKVQENKAVVKNTGDLSGSLDIWTTTNLTLKPKHTN